MFAIGVEPPIYIGFLFDGFQTGSLPYCLVSVSGEEDRMAISHLAGMDPGRRADAFLKSSQRIFAIQPSRICS